MAPRSKLALLKRVLPKYLASCISILTKATFSEDGLMTTHVADFLKDPSFIAAYQQGKSTGSWNGVDLRWRVYTACWAARSVSALPGDFIECGVNRGGMSLAVMEYIGFNTMDKRFFLLDTYCGFPEEFMTVASSVNLDGYEECYNDVVATFKSFENAHIIRGKIPDTLEQVQTNQICYLSIDMNCAEPEIAALRFFWRKMVPGAVVLLDDYAYSESYRRQKDALDNLSKELRFEILSLPTGQGLIVKT
jgi:O-methyltransferase